MGLEQFLKMNGGPFFRGTAPSRFSWGRLLKGRTGFFRFGDNLQADRAAVVQGVQRLKRGHGKKISVQKKEAVPKGLGGMICVPHHFEYMGGQRNGSPFPAMGGLQAVVKTDI